MPWQGPDQIILQALSFPTPARTKQKQQALSDGLEFKPVSPQANYTKLGLQTNLDSKQVVWGLKVALCCTNLTAGFQHSVEPASQAMGFQAGLCQPVAASSLRHPLTLHSCCTQ